MADSSVTHGKTLFVRNLAYSTTNESLEKIFSDVGPLKSCFVVKDKDSGKCRGFGYVRFTILEDAEKALATIKKVDGRSIHIVYANKKEKKKQFGHPGKAKEDEQEALNEAESDDKLRDVKAIKSKDGDKEEEKRKKKKQKFGAVTPVKGQKQAPNPLNEGKRARLIVRNLAFKCSKGELQKAFEKCGNVVDVHIPKKASGVQCGFGFVQFENKAQAGMAVAQINGKSIAGRPVAVDWSLPKNKYESKLPAKSNQSSADASNDQEDDMEVDEEEQDNSQGQGNQSSRKDNKTSHGHSKKRDDKQQNTEEGSEKEEDDDDEADDDGNESPSAEEEEDDDDDDEDDDESSEESEGDEEDSGIDDEEMSKKKPPQPERPSDVSEERTIFIRNLPFTAEEDEVEELFSQFGDVNYARIVKDRNSGMSKGSAFVQFTSKDSATASLEASTHENAVGLNLQGRSLLVSMAVSREQAGVLVQKHEEEKKKKLKGTAEGKAEKDSRNLYLAREGMIRPGTEAAKDVAPGDLALRTKIAEANRIKLKDQNVFVSSTRLCVHNIPPTVEDDKLRKIVLRAVGDKEARLTECRIMRDMNRVNSQGQGKSRGFAFCSFTQHAHALAALKKLNNCPGVFGDKKRPIVEFSLENRKALEAKQKRLEKSKLKIKPKPGGPKQEFKIGDDQGQVSDKKKKKHKQGKPKGEALPLDVKKQQDKVARALYKGPLGLPSHTGPKQRHKPRPSQQANKAGKTKSSLKGGNAFQKVKGNNSRLKQPEKQPKQKQTKSMKMNKKRKDVDGFDKLVASYKQKIMASAKF